MKTPLFTIVTATYNASENILILIESLLSQTYQNFQWVVQDGASTDDTESIIESYSDRLNISFASEKDTGIYDAWNKALHRIDGEWVIFFGADDVFKDKKTLEKLSEFILQNEEDKIITAKTLYIPASIFLNNMRYAPRENYLNEIKMEMPFPHQGLVHRGNLLKKYKFSTQYKICGDYEFLIRTFLSEKDFGVVFYLRTLCVMGSGGVSNTPANFYLLCKERFMIIKKHFGAEVATPAFQKVIQFAAKNDKNDREARENERLSTKAVEK